MVVGEEKAADGDFKVFGQGSDGALLEGVGVVAEGEGEGFGLGVEIDLKVTLAGVEGFHVQKLVAA